MKARQQLLAVIHSPHCCTHQGAWAQQPAETIQAEREVTRTVEQNEDRKSTVQRQGDVATRNGEELSGSRTTDLARDDDGR